MNKEAEDEVTENCPSKTNSRIPSQNSSKSVRRRSFLGITGTATAGLLGVDVGTDPTVNFDDDPLEEIEILTDEYGVSHIYSGDLYSIGFGQGYVQARDRLFELDVARLIGRGESAEWIGPSQLSMDVSNMRELYTEQERERLWEAASPETKTFFEGFSDGVNRQIVEMAATGNVPGEFKILGRPVEPWKPDDSVAWIGYIVGRFGVGGGGEIGKAQNFLKLRDYFDNPEDAYDAYKDLNWLNTDDDHYTTIHERDKTVDLAPTGPDSYSDIPEEQLQFLEATRDSEPWGIEAEFTTDEFDNGLLSGALNRQSLFVAVSGELTESGNAILAGGPQVGTFKPPLYHEIGLHGGGLNATGASVVGIPGMSAGRTPNVAFTVTSGGTDQVDTIAVELDPEDKHRYKWDGEWHEMRTETVIHRPALIGSAAEGEVAVVEQEVARIEQNGAEMPVVEWNEDENIAWCQRVSARYKELEGDGRLRVLGAETIEEAERVYAENSNTFNYVFADDEGNISYLHAGDYPIRPDNIEPRFPQTPAIHHWIEVKTGREMGIHYRNPSTGYFLNWNNRGAKGAPAGDKEEKAGSAHRVDVLKHLIRRALGVPSEAPATPETATNKLNRRDIRYILKRAGLSSSVAQASIEYMIQAGQGGQNQQLRTMAEELERWYDSYCSYDEEDGKYVFPGMPIWEETRRELQELVYDKPFNGQWSGLDFEPTNHAGAHESFNDGGVTLVDALGFRTNHPWVGETPRERDEYVRTAMRRAAETLETRYETSDPQSWLLDARRTPWNLVGLAAPGSIRMSNRASYEILVEVGASFNPDDWAAGSLLPPGNSGHLDAVELAATNADEDQEPDRLTDQQELFEAFEYKPMPVRRKEVETVAVEAETVSSVMKRPDDTGERETAIKPLAEAIRSNRDAEK